MASLQKVLCCFAFVSATFIGSAGAAIVTYETSGSIFGANDVRPFYVFADLPFVFPVSARIQVDTSTPPIRVLDIPSAQWFTYLGAASFAEVRMGEYVFRTNRLPWLNESSLGVRFEPPDPDDSVPPRPTERWNNFQLSVFDQSRDNSAVLGAPSTPLFTPVDIDISGIFPEFDQAGVTTFRIRVNEVYFQIAGTELLSSSNIPGGEISGLYDLPDSQLNVKTSLYYVRDGTGEEILAKNVAVFLAGEFRVNVVSAIPEPSAALCVLAGLVLIGSYVRQRPGQGRQAA